MGLGERGKDLGLLILRIGIGVMLVYRGVGVFAHGLGADAPPAQAMAKLGISSMPQAWGIIAASVLCLGGLLIAFGVLVRLFSLLILLMMLVAINMHVQMEEGMAGSQHAIEAAILFLSLFFMGAGRHFLKLPKKHATGQPK